LIWPQCDATAPQVASIADDVKIERFRFTELMDIVNSTRTSVCRQ